MSSPIFETINLCVSYGREIAIKDVSLSVDCPGKIIAIIGPNGAGKSSFIKSCVGVSKPFSGDVLFWGKKIKYVRDRVSYIPQRSNIDFSFPITVRDVVTMGCYSRIGFFRSVPKNELDLCDHVMESVDLLNHADSRIDALSGGQQQRVLIARSLMQKAEIYFLDEPFVGLDAFSLTKIMSILKKLSSDGKTVIIVHHDLNSVKGFYDDVIMINRRLIAFGDAQSVFTEENISLTYGGFNRIIQEAEKICSDISCGLK